jgi:hypothetical protein
MTLQYNIYDIQKEICNFGFVCFKKGGVMSADTFSLHKSVEEVAKLEHAEGEFVAKDSSVKGCLPGRYLKPTTAAVCLFH